MHAVERNAWTTPAGSSRRACLAAIVVLHAAAVFAWWQLPLGTVQRIAPTRVTAVIVPAPVAERPPEAPRTLPKPLPAKPRATQAPAIAPSDGAPVLAPMAEAPPLAAPAAIAIESAPIVAAATPAPAPAPMPVVAPQFDAAYLENSPPSYPPLARQYREQGTVMLDVRVTASGRADTVEIRKSSGSTRLDDAARAAVMHWRFVPARQGDTPVTAWVVVPVRFALNG